MLVDVFEIILFSSQNYAVSSAVNKYCISKALEVGQADSVKTVYSPRGGAVLTPPCPFITNAVIETVSINSIRV